MRLYDLLHPYLDDPETFVIIAAGLCDLTSKGHKNGKIIVNYERSNSSEGCPSKNVVRIVDTLKQIKGVLQHRVIFILIPAADLVKYYKFKNCSVEIAKEL